MVPALGDPDLSPTADTAFRDSRMPRVRAYASMVCAPGLEDETAAAVFVDFLARAPDGPLDEQELDRILLEATRSAAAGRFAVTVPMGHPELALTAECRAMPELLAAHANGERPGDEELIATHLAGCEICGHTLDLMQRAEQAFARGSDDLPALRIQATSVDVAKARRALPSRPAASLTKRSSNPVPEPETSPESDPEPSVDPAEPGVPSVVAGTRATHRRRSGGLVGAVRRLSRPDRG